MSTASNPEAEALVERFTLKAFVESCLVLEEGVAAAKDIDLGMMAGAGIMPPPLARADQAGLDGVLERLERATQEWGPDFEPPTILRRLVAQGRLGVKSGQGFFPYPRPDAGWDERPVKLETRGDVAIAWLDRPPANSLSPEVIQTIRELWDAGAGFRQRPRARLRLGQPDAVLRRRRHQGVSGDGCGRGRRLLDEAHALLRAMETLRDRDHRRRQRRARSAAGASWRWRCDIRIAADSASFGQPEISLGIIPGFGGTQRLPRLVGEAKALELNLTGEPIGAAEACELGWSTRSSPITSCSTPRWDGRASSPARRRCRWRRSSGCPAQADLDAGIEAEKDGFLAAFGSADGREGIAAFLQKRPPRWKGE